MRTDIWPAPSPEAELLTWVHGRARRITLRRRLVKTTPAAAIVVAVAVALSSAGGTASVSTVDTLRPADSAGAAEQAAGGETTTTTSTTSTTAPVRVRPPERVTAPVVGTVPVTSVTPVYATSHPLLTDPEGDATGLRFSSSDPASDILEMDVIADAESVTTTLRILDLSSSPRKQSNGATPPAHEFETMLHRNDGIFVLTIERDVQTGAITAGGRFAYDTAGTNSVGTQGVVYFPVIGSVDVAAGVVTMTADFDDINQALSGDRQRSHPPIGLGNEVRPTGHTSVPEFAAAEEGQDAVTHSDDGYTYRLGD